MVKVGDAWHIFKELSGGFRSQIFDVFEAAGVTFYSILGSFWRLGLLLATLQAHWVPESRKIAFFLKNDCQMEAILGPF